MSKLTDKRELFCKQYLIDLNAKQAAIRAGYSEKSAESEGSRLLSIAKVQSRIAELKKERIERLEWNADDIIQKVKEIAFTNITDIVNIQTVEEEVDGKTVKVQRVVVSDTHDLPMHVKGAISIIKSGKYGIEVNIKTGMLDKLMKHYGLYEKDNRQKEQIEPDLSKLTTEELKMLGQINRKLNDQPIRYNFN